MTNERAQLLGYLHNPDETYELNSYRDDCLTNSAISFLAWLRTQRSLIGMGIQNLDNVVQEAISFAADPKFILRKRDMKVEPKLTRCYENAGGDFRSVDIFIKLLKLDGDQILTRIPNSQHFLTENCPDIKRPLSIFTTMSSGLLVSAVCLIKLQAKGADVSLDCINVTDYDNIICTSPARPSNYTGQVTVIEDAVSQHGLMLHRNILLYSMLQAFNHAKLVYPNAQY